MSEASIILHRKATQFFNSYLAPFQYTNHEVKISPAWQTDGLTKKSCIDKIALVLKGSSCGKPS